MYDVPKKKKHIHTHTHMTSIAMCTYNEYITLICVRRGVTVNNNDAHTHYKRRTTMAYNDTCDNKERSYWQ